MCYHTVGHPTKSTLFADKRGGGEVIEKDCNGFFWGDIY